jgi:transcription-repair coupling factor (superfamily II helicase)
VAALKAGREPDLLRPLDAMTDINLHAPALLPNDYCGDVHTRLSFYKKLATARSLAQLDHLREELADRFGKLPPPALMLFEVHRLRVLSEPFGIVKVDAAPGVVQIIFKPHAPVDPAAVLRLVQTQREVRLAGNDKLRIERECPEPLQRAQLVRDIIGRLGQPTTPALEATT